MLTEQQFFQKASDFALYKNTKDEYYTLSEFIEKIKDNQKNKDGKIIVLYSHNLQKQHSFVKTATDKGYQVLSLGGPLVSHLISKIESENTDIQFTRVDDDIIDKLIDKDDTNISKLTNKEEEKIQI